MTTLALPDSHRAQTVRIAVEFFGRHKNTRQIADLLGVSEAEIWNRMGLAREIWRQMQGAAQNRKRGLA